MTVRELIKELSKLDDDLTVVRANDDEYTPVTEAFFTGLRQSPIGYLYDPSSNTEGEIVTVVLID